MAQHNEIGKIGENITKIFLFKHGFKVLESNYVTRYGEIDIVATRDSKIHFIEVKSVKVRDFKDIAMVHVKPTDNLTFDKWSKIEISVENYLKHKGVTHGTAYQIDLACVYIQPENREGKVVLMENIHKER